MRRTSLSRLSWPRPSGVKARLYSIAFTYSGPSIAMQVGQSAGEDSSPA